jgi:cytochrome d ubiquinol oxidase subunit II
VLAVVMYVLLDGFDLGVGILFPYAPGDPERDVMMTSVAPIWDANETWLVLGGAALFGAFPLAYSIILSGTYVPLLIMLIALILRGVAFEFRFKAARGRHFWDKAFHYGSVLATFAQGLVLGAFIQGFKVADRNFAGGTLDWLTPFAVMTGVALIAGYALLGCCWLIWKTEHDLQEWAYRTARPLLLAVLLFVGLVSVWTPLREPAIAERWFSWPNLLYLSPVPIATAAATLGLWRAIVRRRERLPFLLAMCLFLLSFLGLGISLWPHAVPPDITIWDAAAPPTTQVFLIIGIGGLLPFILGYTAFSYYVFRGKARPEEGYH